MYLSRLFGQLARAKPDARKNLLSSLSSKQSLSQPLVKARLSSTETNAADTGPIIIEDSCLKRLREILDKPQEEYLRIDVETGGCSGFSYMFDIEKKDNLDPSNDLVIERDSYRIVINRDILPYMKGATIEYKESLIKSSFQVKNPVAETKCSCGASFSIDVNKLK